MCLEFVTKSRQWVSIANVDWQRVPDIRSGHTQWLNARFAVSVRVLGTNSRRASVDRSDRIVSWRCAAAAVRRGMAGQMSTKPCRPMWWEQLCEAKLSCLRDPKAETAHWVLFHAIAFIFSVLLDNFLFWLSTVYYVVPSVIDAVLTLLIMFYRRPITVRY